MAASAKRKVSVTLDADLVAQVEASGDSLSARANAALRDDVERRRRRQALGALLDRLAAERGPLDTSEDESEIRRYMRLLGGQHDPDDLSRLAAPHRTVVVDVLPGASRPVRSGRRPRRR